MLNTSNVAHSILAEEVDNCNSNNNNNNSLLLNDLSFHNDDIVANGSLHCGVYDTTLFDVLKVDPEDFAVSHFSVSVKERTTTSDVLRTTINITHRLFSLLLTDDWLSKLEYIHTYIILALISRLVVGGVIFINEQQHCLSCTCEEGKISSAY